MRLRNSGDWTLVLAIHGSENRVAAQAPPDWQRNAIFYDAAAINQLFSDDERWTTWRDRYGPNHVAIVACQVSIAFEQTLISNLTRHTTGTGSQTPGPTQRSQGMGTGCSPMTRYESLSGARTREQYQNLDPAEQQRLLDGLRDLNRGYGYYGAPPVPDEHILDYYFDEAPSASWAIVEVGIKQADGSTRRTRIPYWNRATGPDAAEFRRLCARGIGQLRERRTVVPPAH